MDLFYDSVNVERKRRVHFNAFMLEVWPQFQREKHAVINYYYYYY